ncbi:hypothetical protein PROFUN_02152 [Planoprotostelium fungivorum]|uniref:Uncharacterized protein n=1 Tax=Planoprotostelium fungivorum TaxID=1890364 RepID=A0A2P6NZD3_9EUKA|nr:hypothetical protein PROFUN_02152 [Planoprotostelium fungivorum]
MSSVGHLLNLFGEWRLDFQVAAFDRRQQPSPSFDERIQGKSAMVVRYIRAVFLSRYDPTIEDQYSKYVQITGRQITLDILDTAGTEQFTSLKDVYMKSGKGFVLVYSVTSESSLEEIKAVHRQLLLVKDADNVPAVLCGNKCDATDIREVSRDDGEKLAKTLNVSFFECSAKTGHGIDELFLDLAKQLDDTITPETEKKMKRRKDKCTLL